MSSHIDTPLHVVILGGGITGLSAAFHLARKHPTLRITLIEKSNRFGGWIRSDRVEVYDNNGNRGSVLLESGPRSIRPNSKSILELIHLLDLRSKVLFTPRASPAGRNRFLHVHPLPGLQPLPYSLFSTLTLPLGRLVLKSILTEPFVSPNRPSPSPLPSGNDEDEGDESVDSFFSRRFGHAFARTLGSALVHGIYAADSRQLSVRAAFPTLRESEVRGNGSVVWGEIGPAAWFGEAARQKRFKALKEDEEEEWEIPDEQGEWERSVRGAALFSFREGIETLVRALVDALNGFSNVTLRRGTVVRRVQQDDEDSFQIHLGEDSNGAAPLKATHVISALPFPVLDSILTQSGARTLPHLHANPHSTVVVLNLVFPAPPKGTTTMTTQQLHPPGFGYLIPRPEQGYSVVGSEHEPAAGLLGVVFDSASLPEQDDEFGTGASRFIKLSAMFGGPYPLPPSPSGPSDPEEEDRALLATVLPLISTQLGGDTPLPEPLSYAVHRNVESIPTYLVGHTARMSELRQALRERWADRLKVVGAGVGGVSVADCVKAGRQAAREVGAQIDVSRRSGVIGGPFYHNLMI